MRTLTALNLSFLLFAFSFSAVAKQSLSDRKLTRKAETHYEFSEYDEALPIYLKLLEKDPGNAMINYHAGICYYYSTTSRPLSVPYFERALKLPGMEKPADLYLHAGLAYLCVNRFSEASSCFHLFRSKEDASYDPTVAERLIKYCENGMAAWAHPARVRTRNLGKNVNSAYPDYAPVLTKDESQLLFTSKRPGTTGGRKDEDGQYYEDIYTSKNLASHKWSESGRYDTSYRAPKFGPFRFFFARAENVSEINTNDHDGSIAMAPDGNDLFIYRYGDIWKAGWNGTKWEKPKKLHQEIDAHASNEPSLCFSPDGNTLFFVSDRKGRMGGKDIWQCRKKEDGTWNEPENLGPTINTAENEDAPFVTKDGNTLYFSSEGHNSMGGYDVFKSTVANDDSWSAPENLGAPINNGGDDIFYTPDQSGNFAYYSTLNRYNEGDLDLYSVMYYPAVTNEAKLIVGKDLPAGTMLHISMKGVNGENEKAWSVRAGDSIQYAFTPGTSQLLTVKADGYDTYSDTITFKSSSYDYSLQQISLAQDNASAMKLQLNSYFFDIDYAVDADTTLDLLADRKKAREIYLGNLRSIDNVFTAWKKQSTELALTKTGVASDISSIATAGFTPVTEFKPGPILFDFNESFVRDDMKAQLDDAANALKRNPDTKLLITGHADSKGSDAYNLELSRRRAMAVRNYFIIAGIDPRRLQVTGEGEKVPLAPNTRDDGQDNPEGRSVNRRVELQVVR